MSNILKFSRSLFVYHFAVQRGKWSAGEVRATDEESAVAVVMSENPTILRMVVRITHFDNPVISRVYDACRSVAGHAKIEIAELNTARDG